ncbi:hypothetical protein AVEN_204481-1 [Araneus ventricosus]|uniref:Uncharacterized protein n=1 Tax=Araneus ventricosus TaxID=182803 RepID=A0A4Y2NEQ5_ARAVE|nr:hypothetical protein AVEN_204481-1 [Araneus ventricosus]
MRPTSLSPTEPNSTSVYRSRYAISIATGGRCSKQADHFASSRHDIELCGKVKVVLVLASFFISLASFPHPPLPSFRLVLAGKEGVVVVQSGNWGDARL